ncbi:MAG: mechanosensitive ion channel family protein [Gammaproteobacteria bacterium]|nr:mechanosensitive ion channel family protein [Gammaproteobacteria bacterium]
MNYLDEEFFHNTLQQWVSAGGIMLGVVIAVWVFRQIFLRRLARLSDHAKTTAGVSIVAVLSATHTLLLLPLALYAADLVLQLPPRIEDIVVKLTVISLLLQVALWGNALIAVGLERYVKSKAQEDAGLATTMLMLGFVGRVVLWAILTLLALSNLGFDITALVTGLGIGGIAVALAAQNILGDLFASLSIVFDKPFVIGDFIIVDDLLGTVETIGMKTTHVRSLSGELIVFSNADLLKARIRNYKRMYERRVVFSLGVTYQTPDDRLTRIPAIVREIITAQPKTRFDRAHFKEYGDFALIFEMVYFVLDSDYNVYMDIHQAINLEIYRRFAQEGIEFAYPTQTLYVNRAEAVPA